MSLKTLLSLVVAAIGFAFLTGFRTLANDQIPNTALLSLPLDVTTSPFTPPSKRDLASECWTYFINGQYIVICYP